MKNAHVFMLALVLVPAPVFAYIGPGVGLGAIATFIAIAIGLFLLIVGFLWYPLKRLLRHSRHAKAETKTGEYGEVKKE